MGAAQHKEQDLLFFKELHHLVVRYSINNVLNLVSVVFSLLI
jgi:hypothetical protein